MQKGTINIVEIFQEAVIKENLAIQTTLRLKQRNNLVSFMRGDDGGLLYLNIPNTFVKRI